MIWAWEPHKGPDKKSPKGLIVSPFRAEYAAAIVRGGADPAKA